MPTEGGLELFVDGLLEVGGEVSREQRAEIDMLCNASGSSFADALEATTTALSGLSRCASLVICPKQDEEIRHVEFVNLGKTPDGGMRALVVIITGTGQVENRIIHLPPGLPQSSLIEAGNFLSTMLAGSTLADAAGKLQRDIALRRDELDLLTSGVVESGVAVLAGNQSPSMPLILRGHANLLEDISADVISRRSERCSPCWKRAKTRSMCSKRCNRGQAYRYSSALKMRCSAIPTVP